MGFTLVKLAKLHRPAKFAIAIAKLKIFVSSCSSMDRMKDSGSFDKGSIPFGSTKRVTTFKSL